MGLSGNRLFIQGFAFQYFSGIWRQSRLNELSPGWHVPREQRLVPVLAILHFVILIPSSGEPVSSHSVLPHPI